MESSSGIDHLYIIDNNNKILYSTRNASHEAYVEPEGNGAASRITTGATADIVRLVSSNSNAGIKFVAPNTIIFKDALNNKNGTTFVKDRYINFIDENGIAYASRFHFVDAALTGDKTVERLGTTSPVSVLQIGDRSALNFNEDLDSTKYTFGADAANGTVTGDNVAFKYYFLGDNDGTWKQQISLVNDTSSPTLRLPGYTGTLTTEEYVNDFILNANQKTADIDHNLLAKPVQSPFTDPALLYRKCSVAVCERGSVDRCLCLPGPDLLRDLLYPV